MDEKLRLNRDTGYYEATITLAVEAEILQRALAQYIEEHHVDICTSSGVQKAVEQVSRLSRWVDHPRTKKTVQTVSTPPVEATQSPIVEHESTPPVVRECQIEPFPHPNKHLTDEQKQDLRKRVSSLPPERWDEVLTPFPENLPAGKSPVRASYHQRRYMERQFLKTLQREMELPPTDRLAAIADAVNGARIR